MQPVVIRQSWTVVVLALFVSGNVAMGIWAISLIALSYTALPFAAHNMVSLAVAGCFWLWLLRHLSSTKPALVIDDRGIVDKASDHEVGLIPWSEIRGAEIVFRPAVRGGPRKVLAIYVRDLESLRARVGIIARIMMRLERRLFGNVIDIPEMSLRTPVEEVLSSIRLHWRPPPRSGMAAELERSASRPAGTNLPD
jgi:hypothetical protein